MRLRRQPWSQSAWDRVDALTWTQHARMRRWAPAWARSRPRCRQLHVVTTAARRAMLLRPASVPHAPLPHPCVRRHSGGRL